MSSLPEITWTGVAVALAVLVGAYVLSRLVRAGTSSTLRWRGRGPEASRIFGQLAGYGVLALGVGAALTILFPSIEPVNILGGVGVISIAAGIAFQTVLGNLFAGIVMLSRDRFRVGDQIAVQETAGTVVAMGLSATEIRTFDGRLVLVPNGTLHSKVVTVQTGYEQVRSSVLIELADDNDLDQVREIAITTMRDLPAVLDEPLPQALLVEVGTRTVQLELRFWSGARQLETKEATHDVIRAVLAAFTASGIETSSDVVTVEPTPGLRDLLRERLPRRG